MAPGRPYWKGYLKLALVSCPIALYTGTSSTERVSFRQINKKTGNRLRQQLIDEVTREPVEGSDKGRGYEYDKGTYIQVEDDELDAIAIESNHTVDIDTFVPRDQIDERYLDSTYYIIPDDQVGQEAFAVVREAMRHKNMVALARIVLAKRERVVMLQPWDRGVMATTLHYPYEVRDTHEYFDDLPAIKIAPDMLKLAEHIVESKEGEFDPSKFVDHYEEAVVEMLKEKQAGIKPPKGKPVERPRNVINLFDALKRSVSAETGKASAGKAPSRAKRGKKRVEGQREMLLPIAGKKGKEAAASTKAPARSHGRQRKAG